MCERDSDQRLCLITVSFEADVTVMYRTTRVLTILLQIKPFFGGGEALNIAVCSFCTILLEQVEHMREKSMLMTRAFIMNNPSLCTAIYLLFIYRINGHTRPRCASIGPLQMEVTLYNIQNIGGK